MIFMITDIADLEICLQKKLSSQFTIQMPLFDLIFMFLYSIRKPIR